MGERGRERERERGREREGERGRKGWKENHHTFFRSLYSERTNVRKRSDIWSQCPLSLAVGGRVFGDTQLSCK